MWIRCVWCLYSRWRRLRKAHDRSSLQPSILVGHTFIGDDGPSVKVLAPLYSEPGSTIILERKIVLLLVQKYL